MKAAARSDELAPDEAIRRRRFLRTWTDADGAGRGDVSVPPELQGVLVMRLNAEVDAVIDEVKSASDARTISWWADTG